MYHFDHAPLRRPYILARSYRPVRAGGQSQLVIATLDIHCYYALQMFDKASTFNSPDVLWTLYLGVGVYLLEMEKLHRREAGL